MQHSLYSFGFNAFKQTKESKESIIESPHCHTHISKVLFASWETTIVVDDENALQFWGFQPPWFSEFKALCQQKTVIHSIFGDPNTVMGLIDQQHNLSFVTAEASKYVDFIDNVEQAVYCQSQQAVYVLKRGTGRVERYRIPADDLVCETVHIGPAGCKVIKMSASYTHLLFLTDSTDAPVYGLGSNRLSQLGMDYQQQKVDSPTMVEYFCALRGATDIACGPFHSAVLLNGDLYTFGWSKDGRLGWGMSKDTKDDEVDIVSLAVFLDSNDRPVEVNAVKVACGSAHTLVLDDQGRVWSCGSNAYGQLGRTILAEEGEQSDNCFRQCTMDKAIDCFTGRWTSFILL